MYVQFLRWDWCEVTVDLVRIGVTCTLRKGSTPWKEKKKKKGARLIFSSLLCAWRQIKYTGGAQISAHRLGKKEKVTGVEKKSEIRWMCEIAVMVIWCAVDPVIGMKSHVLKTTFKQSGFFFFKIVPWIIISAQLSKDLYTTRAQGSLCFFFFFFFSPRFFTHPSVISGVSRVLTPRPPVSSAFRQLKRRFMDFFFARQRKARTVCQIPEKSCSVNNASEKGGGGLLQELEPSTSAKATAAQGLQQMCKLTLMNKSKL